MTLGEIRAQSAPRIGQLWEHADATRALVIDLLPNTAAQTKVEYQNTSLVGKQEARPLGVSPVWKLIMDVESAEDVFERLRREDP